MVCAKCEKKLGKVAASDPYRNRDAQGFLKGSSSKSTIASISSSSSSATTSTRPGPTNKLLGSKNRYNPIGINSSKCKACGITVSQTGAMYCSGCAYKKGLCSICGKMMVDTTKFKMSSV